LKVTEFLLSKLEKPEQLDSQMIEPIFSCLNNLSALEIGRKAIRKNNGTKIIIPFLKSNDHEVAAKVAAVLINMGIDGKFTEFV